MKLVDKIKDAQNFFTFEFFPPRTDQGFDNLLPRIARLAELHPLAIGITWGAGGTTKERSLELAGLTQSEYGIDTILHLTCTNMVKGLVDDALRAAKDKGIQNILALRGDPPRGEDQWIAADPRFTHGIDLVSYIRSSPEFSPHFCIGVAGYPDGHADSLVDEDTELEYLKAKVNAGADFIVTQLFYDVDRYLLWQRKVREKGIEVPIIPGIMPIQTYASFHRLSKLCGTRVPDSLYAALAPISYDDQLVKDFGVSLAVDMIRRLTTEGGLKGVHFCTMNLEKSVQRVLESLQWTGATQPPHNKLITENSELGSHLPVDPHVSELLVTPSNATTSATQGLSNFPVSDSEVGRGELNNAATWDDFPNGRFGDFKSPAFGDQGPWGGLGLSRSEALSQWGNPKTLEDLTNLFLDYLQSKTPTTPFSSESLSAESLTILPHIERLTRRGWWTVGSQPAVDGASSSDPIVGWGPRAGWVFQKGFVEFFCESEEIEAIETTIAQEGKGWVHWFAANNEGECRSNVPEDGRNAVTWGVFPGQEIAQTTIIEKESFLCWKEEAFSIWSEWASFYSPESQERKLLEGVRDRRWLVSVVHHDYRDPQALWNFVSHLGTGSDGLIGGNR